MRFLSQGKNGLSIWRIFLVLHECFLVVGAHLEKRERITFASHKNKLNLRTWFLMLSYTHCMYLSATWHFAAPPLSLLYFAGLASGSRQALPPQEVSQQSSPSAQSPSEEQRSTQSAGSFTRGFFCSLGQAEKKGNSSVEALIECIMNRPYSSSCPSRRTSLRSRPACLTASCQ